MTKFVQMGTSKRGMALCQWLVLTLLCFTTPLLFAQFDTGTINGTVTDPSGAAVAKATVTATNVGTNIAKTTTSDSNGHFVFSALPYGNYLVTASSTGFAEAKSSTIILNVGSVVRVDLAMSVAGSQEKVEVTGTPSTVDIESTETGTTLNSTQVANLPINGRDV